MVQILASENFYSFDFSGRREPYPQGGIWYQVHGNGSGNNTCDSCPTQTSTGAPYILATPVTTFTFVTEVKDEFLRSGWREEEARVSPFHKRQPA